MQIPNYRLIDWGSVFIFEVSSELPWLNNYF